MLKKYKSNSCISLSVRLATGGTTHISFCPISGGGSVYYTENEKIQSGLERHPKYGRLFKLEEIITPAKKPAKKPAGKAAGTMAEAAGTMAEAAGTMAEKEVEKVKVGSRTEAVEWLKDHFSENGYTSLKLRTKGAFEAACKECNVEFEF